jgi:exopolyphosphatase/guanosine-5'-triphosphate,3'-diphosphate pyrophosphatase
MPHDHANTVLCACVDIGSNTTRLLVAEPGPDGLREVLAQRSFTRLGRGTGPDGTISPAKLPELGEVVAAQVQAARALGVERLRVVATAAIRRAPNRAALLAAVRERAGVDVEVLTAEDEARLAFAGATALLYPPPAGSVGVVDVGGGSSELVVGTIAGGVEWVISLPVGSGLLADAHLHSDPPAPDELAALRAAAAAAFTGVRAPRPDAAVAVGGSATSLRRLVGPVLDERSLAEALEVVVSDRAAAVARRHDLDAERVRLLPAGLAVLEEAARAFSAPLTLALGGLREGVVLAETP